MTPKTEQAETSQDITDRDTEANKEQTAAAEQPASLETAVRPIHPELTKAETKPMLAEIEAVMAKHGLKLPVIEGGGPVTDDGKNYDQYILGIARVNGEKTDKDGDECSVVQIICLGKATDYTAKKIAMKFMNGHRKAGRNGLPEELQDLMHALGIG